MSKKIDLFLSGSQHLFSQQLDVNLSLGGFCSNTPVPKNLINGLFSPISSFDIANPSTDTLAIFIKNTGTEILTTIKLKQIYERLFENPSNICKFEWGVVIPNDQGFIELIGNKKEIPYYAEFFEPNFVRERCVLKILTIGAIGETITLLGETFQSSGNSLENLVDDIVLKFKDHSTFYVEKKSQDEVFIERKDFQLTNDNVSISSTGTYTSNSVQLEGSNDEYELLPSALAVNGIIGIWIKREILPEKFSCDTSLSDKNKKEELEVIIDFD